MTDNREQNIALWDRYAEHWESLNIIPEDPSLQGERLNVTVLGQEWGTVESCRLFLRRYIYPYCTKETRAIEIGCGAGRISREVAPRVRSLLCCDTSDGMLTRCAATLVNRENVSYVNSMTTSLLPEYAASADLVYSFDVMVHMDLHTLWQTISQMTRLLTPGGHLVIHTANLLTREGWDRFVKQPKYSIQGFYFITPEIATLLLEKSGLQLIEQSIEDANDFYSARDFMAIARLPK